MAKKRSNKRFTLSLDGKSPAFLAKNGTLTLNSEDLSFLEAELKRQRVAAVRACLHPDPSSKLQIMALALTRRGQSPIHRHPSTEECYFVLKGKVRIEFFNRRGRAIQKQILDSRRFSVSRVPAGQAHQVTPLTPTAIFLEFRSGPFIPGQDSVVIRKTKTRSRLDSPTGQKPRAKTLATKTSGR